MTNAIKHTATKINTFGNTPTYNYRGIAIWYSSGSKYGRGWLTLFVGGKPHFTTTLESAKDYVDDTMNRQNAETTEYRND